MSFDASMPLLVGILSILVFLYLVVAVMKSAFRELGKVASQSLGQHDEWGDGSFLRKSLSQPTPLWFSLQIASAILLISIALVGQRALETGPQWNAWQALVGGLGGALACLLLLDLGLPPLLVRGREEEVVLFLLSPMKLLHYVLLPLSYPLASVGERNGETEVGTEVEPEPVDEEEIQAYIEMGEREGILEEREKILIRGVVEFGDAVLDEVMTPRTDIIAVPVGTPLVEVRHLMSEAMHTRMPVFEGNLDTLKGIVHMKDLIGALDKGELDKDVETILRPVYYAPATMKVHDLLRLFQERRITMAVVVDEYGGTEGLVTVEDLIEEIVGEIQDEHEPAQDWVVQESDGVWEVDGRAELDDLSGVLGVDLETEEVETVGGLVFSRLGYLPKEGESLEWKSHCFHVLEADEKRIYRLRIEAMPPDEPEAEREAEEV